MTVPNPFGGNPFEPPPAGYRPSGPPGWGQSMPVAPRDEANTLATLSVVFAFVFAPAGAVLGHLGLSQIGRTRQRGRERALIGVTLSYAFITTAVVALVVWAALGDTPASPPTSTALSTIHTASPATSTTSSATPLPPPPTVKPDGLDALLPTAAEINAIPDMPADMQLKGVDIGLIDRAPDITINPTSCYTVFGVADTHGYDAAATQGVRANGYRTATKSADTIESVAGYADASAAQAALQTLLADWRSCGMTFSYSDSDGGKRVATYTVTAPADAGNGITTTTATATQAMTGVVFRAIAAKANVVVDVLVSSKPGTDRTANAVAIADTMLNKIPGPR